MKKLFVLIAVCTAMDSVASGAYIANGTTITSILPRNGTQDMFIIDTSGGTGICAGKRIYFPLSVSLVDGSSSAAYNRTYSALLAAFAGGNKVTIHNPIDGDSDSANIACSKAADIIITK